MLTSIAVASNISVVSSFSFPFPGLSLYVIPTTQFLAIAQLRTRAHQLQPWRICDFKAGGEYRSVCYGVLRRCKGRNGEGDWDLEEEILEFMRKSKKPEAFPTKKELVDEGRMDLVKAISKQGGWLSLGWDLDEDGDDEDETIKNHGVMNWDTVMADEAVHEMGDIGQDINHFNGHQIRSFEADSSQPASFSGRSLDSEVEDAIGIDGIFSRLEKQRNVDFGIDLTSNEFGTRNSTYDATGDDRNERHASSNPKKEALRQSNSYNPNMWRSWSNQRAGYPNADFEAAEITFNKNTIESVEKQKETILGGEKRNSDHIEIRLQHLELELASALGSLRSKADEFITQKGHDERSSEDLRRLSDVYEFQETEIMRAQDRLRSTRAKLAVLEGKLALSIIEAQKIAEEKQRKIDGARRVLRNLRTFCVIWPNSASEVILSGSFDGWATQRKMVRSSTGIFSLCLKLYPGRYEIKFIVDGIWKVDPLRSIVRNNGHENNLIIIS